MDHWIAILTTNERPELGSRCLIAMPTPNSKPHGVGRIVSAEERPGWWTTPTFTLTVAVESTDEEAARAEYPHANALDCYPTAADAERWHAIDEQHVKLHGYGRNHW